MKQWEGVQSNGLPTPTFNFIKRVVGFIVASITTDNIKINASAMTNTPGTEELVEPVRVVNEEFESITEFNDIPALLREFARNAAVDGDGCIYTYWDADAEVYGNVKGAIRSEIIANTRVFFGNPSDRMVQNQPYIIIASREPVRSVRMRAKENGIEKWEDIMPDHDDEATDAAKYVDDNVTVLLTLWRDDEDGEIHAYETTENCEIRKPWSMGIKLYPICWLPWDYVRDSYHGQAMITGLIPNQIFVNKAWAMAMLSIMKSAFPKVVYDKTRVAKWDNRVGAAIGINGGDVNSVARNIDPPVISPQVSQFITSAIEETEKMLGATAVALGDTRPDNTSAIIALQRAASTPSELTKQNLYKSIEELFRIYLEFMGEYYGKRMVDMPTPPQLAEVFQFTGQQMPEEVQMEFDFSELKDKPMMLKLDVGASSYYSEIASMQTLDNLLMNGHITPLQYLERIPDGYIPKRRALISEMKQQQAMMEAQMQSQQAADTGGVLTAQAEEQPEIEGGKGYGALQRAVNEAGV